MCHRGSIRGSNSSRARISLLVGTGEEEEAWSRACSIFLETRHRNQTDQGKINNPSNRSSHCHIKASQTPTSSQITKGSDRPKAVLEVIKESQKGWQGEI